MYCPKCGKETDTLYSVSENTENARCSNCVGGMDLLTFAFILFIAVMAILGMLAG